MESIAILGAGTWGTALAAMLKNEGKSVTMWSAVEDELKVLKNTGTHPKLAGFKMPDGIEYTADLETACKDKNIIMIAVASVYVRSVAEKLKGIVKENQIIVDVAKGIEADTLFTLTQVIEDELKNSNIKTAVLSGPTHAEEVALGMPTTIVSASEDLQTAMYVQQFFSSSFMRVYTNTDVRGVELCGAFKNIIALAAGISDGLGYGDNAKAALITRGLAELFRLGEKTGSSAYTFSGLAGVGDLIVTCTSKHSRNNTAGYLIGKGMSPSDAVKEVKMVVEGINVLPAAVKTAKKYNVDMPIVFAVNDIVNNNVTPLQAVDALFGRALKTEFRLTYSNDI